MTPAEVVAKLRAFNDWRRGGDTEYPGPLAVDEAIDAAVEMIERLEAAEKSDAESLAMYRKARDERDALRVELNEILYGVAVAHDTIKALRAKIEAMERQEPVATIHINSITGNPSVDFIPGHCYLHHNSSLYALPGAKGEDK